MTMASPHMNNFQVNASFTALEVLADDPYFQEALPTNWHEIILKILEKLLPKAQSARFEDKLCDLSLVQLHGEENATAALPDAIKQLISALHEPSSKPTSVLEQEFGRTYLPSLQQRLRPSPCREEERLEEKTVHRHRPLLRPVH